MPLGIPPPPGTKTSDKESVSARQQIKWSTEFLHPYSMLGITKKDLWLVAQGSNEEPFQCVHVCEYGEVYSLLFVGLTGISTRKDSALKLEPGYVPQELGVIPGCNYIISANKA